MSDNLTYDENFHKELPKLEENNFWFLSRNKRIEHIFEKYILENNYITFIETEGLRVKDGIGSSGKKVGGSNICEFVSIKLKTKK